MGDTLVSQPGTMHSTSGLTAASKVPTVHRGVFAELAQSGVSRTLSTAYLISSKSTLAMMGIIV